MSTVLIVRVGLFLLLLAYLGLIAISHAQPLNSGLEAPLAFGGWLALVGIAVVTWLRQRRIGLRRSKLQVRHLLQPPLLQRCSVSWRRLRSFPPSPATCQSRVLRRLDPA